MSSQNSYQPFNNPFSGQEFRQFVPKGRPAEQLETIHLTGLFQQTLQKYLSHTGRRNSVIIRLDKLPVVTGVKEQLERLCNTLITLIINDLPRRAGKFFLHIRCEKINEEVIDLGVKNGFAPYCISFYTNVLPDDNWRFFFKEKLSECADIACKNKGAFSFKQAFGSCCLFSLTFLGKPE